MLNLWRVGTLLFFRQMTRGEGRYPGTPGPNNDVCELKHINEHGRDGFLFAFSRVLILNFERNNSHHRVRRRRGGSFVDTSDHLRNAQQNKQSTPRQLSYWSNKTNRFVRRRAGRQDEMAEKFREAVGNSEEHRLAFRAGTRPENLRTWFPEGTTGARRASVSHVIIVHIKFLFSARSTEATLRQDNCQPETTDNNWRTTTNFRLRKSSGSFCCSLRRHASDNKEKEGTE